MISMASRFALLFAFSAVFVQATLAEVICEDLPLDVCAYSISSSGKRCLIETSMNNDLGNTERQCETSGVVVEKMSNYIESEECVNACGVDRNSVGISSDLLLEPQFTSKLCSSSCYNRCPNIVDLCFNLAAGEGAFLPDICEAAKVNSHRSMVALMSSGGAASGPISSNDDTISEDNNIKYDDSVNEHLGDEIDGGDHESEPKRKGKGKPYAYPPSPSPSFSLSFSPSSAPSPSRCDPDGSYGGLCDDDTSGGDDGWDGGDTNVTGGGDGGKTDFGDGETDGETPS